MSSIAKLAHAPLVGALVLLAASCAPPQAEVVLIVDTDLEVGVQIDQIVAVVTTAGGTRKSAVARLGPGELPLPRTLGILYEGGGRATNYRVEVSAERIINGSPVAIVSRDARFSFVEGERRQLQMDLLQSCINVLCGSPELSCTEIGCTDIDVVLQPYSGTASALSAAQTLEIVEDGATDFAPTSTSDAGLP